MFISLDTETTGVDFAHGAKPFLVTTCDDAGTIRFWEWDVDPLTRNPEIPSSDCAQIQELIDGAELIYLQNAKFDAHALRVIGVNLIWGKVRDTLVMGHLLASNHPHDLTSMCLEYLGVNIEKYEIAVRDITKPCRVIARREFPTWQIANEGLPSMPSIKPSSKRDEDKPWKNDMWLARALAKAGSRNYIPAHWLTACAEYANADSSHTLFLGLAMEQLIKERDLWSIYEHRLVLPRIAFEMELVGVTVDQKYTERTIKEYESFVVESACALQAIAEEHGHTLDLADGAMLNDNMRDFFYGAQWLSCVRCEYRKRVKHWAGEILEPQLCPQCWNPKRKKGLQTKQILEIHKQPNLNLPTITGKTGTATLDKNAMHDYLITLDEDHPALEFIRLLLAKRKHDTDLTYMKGYFRYKVPIDKTTSYFRIHPSLNPFGTDHLRWSSNNPNLQNVSKQEDKCSDCEGDGCAVCGGTGKSRISVRYCFGPAEGREWWTMDYQSIERRIPPYECGEPKMLEVFERPDEPPYWGSLYNLTASVLYPDEYWPLAERKNAFKLEQPKLYKQAKFFDLAKQYGCGRRKGDALSKVRGSFDLVDNEFPLLAALQTKYLRMAEKTGWVETLPDRSIDETKGYPILASRTEDGRVLSTTPFNYHVSGTACWCKNMALIRCAEQLRTWQREEGFDGWLSLEIHDELLFDFPKGKSMEENLPRALKLKQLMELSGDNLIPRIPTPVSVEYHTHSWAEGVLVDIM